MTGRGFGEQAATNLSPVEREARWDLGVRFAIQAADELMEHMGHDSARAALICLHMSAERQRAIADQVGKNAKAALVSTSILARETKGTP